MPAFLEKRAQWHPSIVSPGSNAPEGLETLQISFRQPLSASATPLYGILEPTEDADTQGAKYDSHPRSVWSTAAPHWHHTACRPPIGPEQGGHCESLGGADAQHATEDQYDDSPSRRENAALLARIENLTKKNAELSSTVETLSSQNGVLASQMAAVLARLDVLTATPCTSPHILCLMVCQVLML